MKLIKKLLLAVLMLCILAVGILLGMDNQQPITLRFLDWQTPETSLYFWLLISLAIGFLAGSLLSAVGLMKQALRIRKLENLLTQSKQQVQNIQTQKLAKTAWEKASP